MTRQHPVLSAWRARLAPITRRRRRAARLVAALTVAAVGVSLVPEVSPIDADPAYAASYVTVSGSGSTWSQNALDAWRVNVKSNYGINIEYRGMGSSVGRRDFIQRTTDFAVSEIPFQRNPDDGGQPEIPGVKYAYMPIVAGGTSLMYNLRIAGNRVTNLRLSGATIAKIFTGVITRWNDPAIQNDNPGLAMPDREIIPVVRAEGSGTTAQFTQWMSKTQGDIWNAYCRKVGRATPCGLTSQYPVTGNMKAQAQSNGVAGYVAQSYGEGAITYVEYSYAINAGFPVAKVLNQAGYYIEPTAPSVAVALTAAQINDNPASPDYLTQILDGVYNSTDPRTYPLSSYSYMILPTEVAAPFNLDKGYTLGTFANYFLCEGQQSAERLGYSPLPMNLVMAGLDQVRKMPGTESLAVDVNRCNNPTFRPGDDPANNQLARNAPQPAACDRAGPTQCTTGTAGAKSETPVSGSGGGGGGGGTSNNQNDAGAGPANGGAYDADGNPVTGNSSAGRAVASPLSLSEAGWGSPQTLMVLAGLLLIAFIVAPPLFSRRLRESRSSASEGGGS